MRLYLECKPDETVAIALGFPRQNIIHSHSKGRVSRQLACHSGVTGMVDQDFGESEPTNLRKFVQISSEHDLLLKNDRGKNNRLIVICPRLEDWLIKTARAGNLKMSDFNLSESPRDLHAEINHRLPNLERLVNELLKIKSPRILYLRELLLGENRER